MNFRITNLLIPIFFGLAALSCGDKNKPTWLREIGPYDSSVGTLRISYKNADNTAFVGSFDKPEAERRTQLTLDGYYQDHNWSPPLYPVWIYPTLVSGVPCGAPNGGGCANAERLYTTGSVKSLYHEINHLRLLLSGDPNWTQHSGKEWEKVWKWDDKSDQVFGLSSQANK